MAASTRNFAELCCHYGISLKRGYKWRTRFIDQGSAGLAIASRRPHTSPGRTPANMEAQVLAMRQAHPAWGDARSLPTLSNSGQRRSACEAVKV